MPISCRRVRPARSGIAIFLVVMVASIVGVFVVIMMFQGGQTRRATKFRSDQAQAEFMAKGAHQHFLLKFKLLPTELYDAVSYANGKNPYFDFSLDVSSLGGSSTFVSAENPDRGPMFFTGTGTTQIALNGTKLSIKRSAEGDGIYQNPAVGFTGSATDNRDKMEFLLNHYLLDIATNYPVLDVNRSRDESIVVVDSQPHRELARFGLADRAGGAFDPGANPPLQGWRDPFFGRYFVRQISVLGIGGADAGRKYQADSVLLMTEASIRRDGQISLVTEAGGQPEELIVHRETKRSLESETSGGVVQLREELESIEDYNKRVSEQRTEVQTGIYFISRSTK